ncbi:MAG: type I methionyl aminopeptidase [Elusimicrobia bacterium]|nr:type I methionyl aminopeptidase [Elusimicrobiota bacterium]
MSPVAAVELKSAKELALMREAGAIVAYTLRVLSEHAQPGVTTEELDKIAASEIAKKGAQPAFLHYRGYPKTLCVSVNEEVVHGIPRPDKVLKAGDIVSLDFGVIVKGYFADAAVTVPVGKVAPNVLQLVEATKQSLEKGIDQMWPDKRLGDIAAAVQTHVESKGFSVVRSFVGHGIGRALHEDPPVPNFGRAGTGLRLAPGMVLAVEPMVNMGGHDVRILDDGWTAVTRDGKWSAHFEHTIAVTKDGPEILTVER